MSDADARAIRNRVLVEQSMDLVYSTHIEDAAIAETRGAVVRALNKLHVQLGGRDLIREREPRFTPEES